MSIEKLIEKTLAEGRNLGYKSIKNYTAFSIGDTLKNNRGETFKILDIVISAHPKRSTASIQYDVISEGKTKREFKNLDTFFIEYFDFDYKDTSY